MLKADSLKAKKKADKLKKQLQGSVRRQSTLVDGSSAQNIDQSFDASSEFEMTQSQISGGCNTSSSRAKSGNGLSLGTQNKNQSTVEAQTEVSLQQAEKKMTDTVDQLRLDLDLKQSTINSLKAKVS